MIKKNPEIEIDENDIYNKQSYISFYNEYLYEISDDKNIPYFSFQGKTVYARPCNIYDGDTFSIIFKYNLS